MSSSPSSSSRPVSRDGIKSAVLSSGRPVSRELSPRARPGARPPSEDVDQLLQRHRTFVKQAIRECRNVEEKRAVRYERAQSASERTQLDKRFEMERELDRQKLQRLTEDYVNVQKAIKSGEFPASLVEQRKAFSKKPVLPKLDVEHNRFSGCETYTDIIKHESAIIRFDKIDAGARRKLQPKFDPYPVQKNLKLLQQKRDILTQLINVQTREIRAAEGGGGGMALMPPKSNNWDTMSRASSRTSASWASFATARHNVPPPVRKAIVPQLKI